MPKAKRTPKQDAASRKNILTYEKKDDSENILKGFVMGFVACFIVAFIAFGLFV